MAGSFKVLLGLSKRLMTFQTALDQDVDVVIRTNRGRERPDGSSSRGSVIDLFEISLFSLVWLPGSKQSLAPINLAKNS